MCHIVASLLFPPPAAPPYRTSLVTLSSRYFHATEYTDAVIDETPEVTRKAKEIVSTRIRYKLDEFGLVPKLLMTCNPSPGWVKEDYICDDMGVPVELPPNKKFVRAILSDNPNEEFRRLYESQLESMSSEYDKQRLLYGNWNVRDNILNPFAFQYSKDKHEAPVQRQQGRQIFVSMDFNISPMAVTYWHIWEDTKGHHAHCFDEETIENANVHKWCDLMKLKYPEALPLCKITGDAMGKERNMAERDNASNYELIRRSLNLRNTQIELHGNPTHENSRSEVNYVLFYHPDFKINPVSCPNTSRDMQSVECDAHGGIIKKKRSDINQRADHLDTVRYCINSFMRDWIRRHQKTNAGR